jgi:hypothetical protein
MQPYGYASWVRSIDAAELLPEEAEGRNHERYRGVHVGEDLGGGEDFIVSCARALMDFSMGSSLLFMSNHGRPVSEDLPINRPQQLLLTSGVQGIVRTLL